ncbi:MAG: class I SAM-dependent methyltransferase [Planctomycetota bacterium]
MKFQEVHKLVQGVPFISERNAQQLYKMIIENEFRSILELGIAHGTATCYMAAAVEELGDGHIQCVDLEAVKDEFEPSAESQIQKCGFDSLVDIARMQTGYTWFLHDEIKRQTREDFCVPKYDLCIIDGPKNWTIDGCAFFLADKLLREGGLLIFDDYLWTYDAASSQTDTTDGISHRSLSSDERKIPQIREVFELLVKQHPNYSGFEVNADGNWAMARKVKTDQKDYTLVYNETVKDFWGYACRRLGNFAFPKVR